MTRHDVRKYARLARQTIKGNQGEEYRTVVCLLCFSFFAPTRTPLCPSFTSPLPIVGVLLLLLYCRMTSLSMKITFVRFFAVTSSSERLGRMFRWRLRFSKPFLPSSRVDLDPNVVYSPYHRLIHFMQVAHTSSRLLFHNVRFRKRSK